MYKGKKILAVIPARKGSKGLPGKNIMPLAGKPLIAWSIEQAKASKYIDRIVVSTDSKEIANVALSFGADVPFLRPLELSGDESTSVDVILHCIDELENQDCHYDFLVFLEPTSPLRETIDINSALEILVQSEKAESIVGVCKVEACHPAFLVKLKDKFLHPYINKGFKVLRRQEIDDLYFFEGSLYISKIESIKIRKNFYHEKCLGYKVPKWKSFEVDDITDFIIIEAILNARLAKML